MRVDAYLAGCVASAVNRLLTLDPETAEGLAELEGAALEIHLRDVERCIRLWPRSSGVAVELLASDAAEPLPARHVRISGPPATLLRLAASGESLEGTLPGGVSVSGDVRLAHRLRELLRSADLDWEEPISHLLGDSVAHEIGRGVRGALAWTRGAADTLLLDVGEYLREERRGAPDRGQLEDFVTEVERLRDDVERLQQRIARLTRAVRSPEP